MDGQTEIRNMHDIIEHYAAIGDEPAHSDVKKYAYDLMERLEIEGAAETRPFPDTLPTLAKLQDDGLRMGIVTNSARKAVEVLLRRFPMRGYFEVITTRDDVTVIKPDPGMVKHAIDAMGVSADECFLVGDAPGDILAAKSLDMVSVGIPRGSATRDALLGAKPDYVIESLDSLPELVIDLKAHEKK